MQSRHIRARDINRKADKPAGTANHTGKLVSEWALLESRLNQVQDTRTNLEGMVSELGALGQRSAMFERAYEQLCESICDEQSSIAQQAANIRAATASELRTKIKILRDWLEPDDTDNVYMLTESLCRDVLALLADETVTNGSTESSKVRN